MPIVGDIREQERLEIVILDKIMEYLNSGFTYTNISYGLPGYGYMRQEQNQTVKLIDEDQGKFSVGLTILQTTRYENPLANVLDMMVSTGVENGIKHSLWYLRQRDFVHPEYSKSYISYAKERAEHILANTYSRYRLRGPSVKEKITFLRRIISSKVDLEDTEKEYEELEKAIKNGSDEDRLESLYWNNAPKFGFLSTASIN